MIPFVKMHGCGNDFIVVRESDLGTELAADTSQPGSAPEPAARWIVPPEELARRACDRHFGVGADGVLVYGPLPDRDGLPRIRMLYWNADGSRAEMCGNGARCIVRLAYERGECGPTLCLETDAGPRPAAVVLATGGIEAIEIDMGAPGWDPESVPARADAPLVEAPVEVGGTLLEVTALSMGNPHAVVFVADRDALERVPLERLGRALAEHALFPRGANASFVAAAADALHIRTWERGSGATLACGTAMCAAFAAATRTGRLDAERAAIRVPGGSAEVRRSANGHLWLRGPASYVAEGTLAPELFA